MQTKARSTPERKRAIVIRGLPGCGKTTLANQVVESLDKNAFQINADKVRAGVNKGLGFTLEDRVENARRLGALAELASSNGYTPVVDFVMPTYETFDSFLNGLGDTKCTVWSLESEKDLVSRYEDTARMFQRSTTWTIEGVKIIQIPPYPLPHVHYIAQCIVTEHLKNV